MKLILVHLRVARLRKLFWIQGFPVIRWNKPLATRLLTKLCTSCLLTFVSSYQRQAPELKYESNPAKSCGPNLVVLRSVSRVCYGNFPQAMVNVEQKQGALKVSWKPISRKPLWLIKTDICSEGVCLIQRS